jgi:hypothetical protein
LVLLDDKVKLDVPLGELAVHEPDARKLIAFLKAMEFSTLTRRVAEYAQVDPSDVEADAGNKSGASAFGSLPLAEKVDESGNVTRQGSSVDLFGDSARGGTPTPPSPASGRGSAPSKPRGHYHETQRSPLRSDWRRSARRLPGQVSRLFHSLSRLRGRVGWGCFNGRKWINRGIVYHRLHQHRRIPRHPHPSLPPRRAGEREERAASPA